MGKIAVILLLAMSIFTFGLGETSEAFRMQILKVYHYVFDGHNEIRIEEDSEYVNEDMSLDNSNSIHKQKGEEVQNIVVNQPAILPEFCLKAYYIPKGFYLVKNDTNGLLYTNNSGNILTVDQVLPNGSYTYNTEGMVYSEHTINGDVVSLYSDNKYHTAIWEDTETNYFIIIGEMKIDEFMKFIEGLTYNK